jgi:hypothetical protein
MARVIDTIAARYGRGLPRGREGQHKPRPGFRPDASEVELEQRKRDLLAHGIDVDRDIDRADIDRMLWLWRSFRPDDGRALDEGTGTWRNPTAAEVAEVVAAHTSAVMGAAYWIGGPVLLTALHELHHAVDKIGRERAVVADVEQHARWQAERDAADEAMFDRHAGTFPSWWYPGAKGRELLAEAQRETDDVE